MSYKVGDIVYIRPGLSDYCGLEDIIHRFFGKKFKITGVAYTDRYIINYVGRRELAYIRELTWAGYCFIGEDKYLKYYRPCLK